MKYLNIAITTICASLIILCVIYIINVNNNRSSGALRIKKVVVNQLYYTYEPTPPSNSPNNPPPKQKEHLKQKNISGNRGETLLFTANVIQINGPSQPPQNEPPRPEMMGQHSSYPPNLPVIWAVTGGVASTIDNRGMLTIGKLETAKKLIVTATSSHMMDTSKKRKSGKVTVALKNPLQDTHVGPGGGIVFYDKGEYTDGWRYLEAAPVNSEIKATWGLYDVSCSDTSDDLGTGKANTATIIKRLNTYNETGKAAQRCTDLSINGIKDWFLPSKDELNEMYKFFISDKEDLGDFKGKIYWTSSVYSGDTSFGTWYQDFNKGTQDYSKIALPREEVYIDDMWITKPPMYEMQSMMMESTPPYRQPPPRQQPNRGTDRKYTELFVRAVRAF